MPGKKFYAVKTGRVPGIYRSWSGPGGAQEQVHAYPKAAFKGFATKAEAEAYMTGQDQKNRPAATPEKQLSGDSGTTDRIEIFTDGGSLGNPGPGGYGVVIIAGDRRELSGGYRLTTNNRMELMGAIRGLAAVSPGSQVLLQSDSRYLVDGITRGWATGWRRRGWKKSNGQPTLNADLWEQLLGLVAVRDVQFRWVKGHAGDRENERCDQLARRAAAAESLPPDSVYETTAALQKGQRKLP